MTKRRNHQEAKGNACLDDGDGRKQRCSSVVSAHGQWKLERCKRTQNLKLTGFSTMEDFRVWS